jgi:hypothetical protein
VKDADFVEISRAPPELADAGGKLNIEGLPS